MSDTMEDRKRDPLKFAKAYVPIVPPLPWWVKAKMASPGRLRITCPRMAGRRWAYEEMCRTLGEARK